MTSTCKGDRAFSVIAEPNERSNVVSFAGTRDILLVLMLNNVRSELYAFRCPDGRWVGERVDAPKLGTLGIVSTDEWSDQYFLSYQGFLTPTSLYHVSDQGKMKKVKTLPHFFDAKGLATEQFEAISKDGTKSPVFRGAAQGDEGRRLQPDAAVRLRRLRDRDAAQLLRHHGRLPGWPRAACTSWRTSAGAASSVPPGTRRPSRRSASVPTTISPRWPRTWSAARSLRPAHLGIMGGSNGGLLMGVEFTQRPDLYNAVVCLVPLLDMQRYNKLLAGASWMAEYGNPDVPEEWAYISKYSPYHNVRADGKYPQVFFYTSTADDRVHPGHARKMAARMEEMGHKVYYYENMEGGHAAAATNKQQALRTALSYSYLWMQLK